MGWLSKDSDAQKAAIRQAADDNHDDDRAARANYGRVELNYEDGNGPLMRDRNYGER